MNRARWRFGSTQQQQPSQEPTTSASSIIYSADAKKFGLENFGNTCYANSVIQTLYFCSPFRDLMIHEPDRSNPQEYVVHPSAKPATLHPPPTPNRPKPERKPSLYGTPSEHPEPANTPHTYIIPSAPPTLFSALRSLFAFVSFHPSQKGTIAPRAFIEKLKEFNELFRSSMHQDAHEFLNYLLNKIVEEIEEERKQTRQNGEDLSTSITTLSPPSTVHTGSNAGTPAQNATLVHKLFEGVLTSETRCLTCETVSSRDESFLDLSIDIERNSSVTACLRQFSASEMLSQKNKFFCDSCCGLQEAEKRMKIKKLPNILALHLKRFKYQDDVQKYIKLTYRVAFPFELRLFNTVDDADNADRLYNLSGIVVHIGSGPHHGHYISIVKTLGQWSVFDDDNVYPILEQDISKYFGEANAGSAYVLYYQAADIDLASLGLNSRPPEEQNEPQNNFDSISSRPPSPTQDLDVVPSFPPGLLPAQVDDPQEPVAKIIPPVPLESNNHTDSFPATVTHTDADVVHPPVAQPSSVSSTKAAVNSIITGLRRPSRPKSSQFDAKKKPSIPDQLARPGQNDIDTSTKLLPRRPATSAGAVSNMVNKEDKHVEKTGKETKWFRRRSFRGLDKAKHSNEVQPPLPALSKTEDRSLAPSLPNGLTTESDRHKARSPTNTVSDHYHNGQRTGAYPPSNEPDHVYSQQQTTSQHRRYHRTGGRENPSPGNSISSYGSTSFSPSPASPIVSAQSSSSSTPATASSHSLSPNRHPSLTSSQIPNSPRALEHRKSRGSRRPDHRPLPPIPPSPITPSQSAGAAQNAATEHIGNGHAHEPILENPSRSAATLSSFTHIRKPSQNGSVSATGEDPKDTFGAAASQIKRASRKLSFTAPLFGFGRKDKEKRQDKERPQVKEIPQVKERSLFPATAFMPG